MLQCRKCVSALDNAHYCLCIDTVAAAPRPGTLVYKYADIATTNTTNTPPLVLSLSALLASAGAHIHA